jgi:hypothetical protein
MSAVGLSSAFASTARVVTVTAMPGASGTTKTRTLTADDSWIAGPPYAVPEEVFDEHSLDACSLSPDADDE